MAKLASGTAPAAGALTVYFDGGCPVCAKEIAHYRRQPGAEACTWVDAARCDEAALGDDLSRDAALKRFHVRQPDGSLVDGMRGFALLWQALPRTAWLGRLAGSGPMPALLDAAYAGFLRLRRLWRPAPGPWPDEVMRDLRSDDAGEVGAVQIYRGVLAVSRDPALRAFAAAHRDTEQAHLEVILRHLPAARRSRLLPAWRVAGWLTGALPALFGPRAVYATVAAVETFVDRHYAEQIERVDGLRAALPPASDDAMQLAVLRADLERCRNDELQHRDEAIAAGAADGLAVKLWTTLVAHGSATAVTFARRF